MACPKPPKSLELGVWAMVKLCVQALRVEYNHFKDRDIPSDKDGISDEELKEMHNNCVLTEKSAR